MIRSLYFDSLEDIDWQEKEDGIELRRKIRLRNYGSQSSFAKLEMKQKQGSNQKKAVPEVNQSRRSIVDQGRQVYIADLS